MGFISITKLPSLTTTRLCPLCHWHWIGDHGTRVKSMKLWASVLVYIVAIIMWVMWEEHKVKLQNGECEELLSLAIFLQWELLLFIVSHVICTCLRSWWDLCWRSLCKAARNLWKSS